MASFSSFPIALVVRPTIASRLAAVLLALALIAPAAAPTWGQAPAQVPTPSPAVAPEAPAAPGELRIGLQAEPATLDPHFRDTPAERQIAAHIFEPLVLADDDGRLAPGLALSWRQRDATRWEFALRPGVKFHDGGDFTAEDVAFTLQRAGRVPQADAVFARAAHSVAEIRVVDPLTLLFTTAEPDTDLPQILATLPIVSKRAAAGPAPEGRTTAEFDSGAAAVGTGPYRFEQWLRGDRLVLVASPHWWGGQPQWRSVAFMVLPDPEARLAALRDGKVDIVEQPPQAALGALRRDGDIVLSEGASARLVHVALDAKSETLRLAADSTIVNPLRNERVREALDLAIDREQIVRNALQGRGSAAAGLEPPGLRPAKPAAGSAAGESAYNPARARKLLADAGYVEGFALTLTAPDGRFRNVAEIAREVAGMWARIGVKVSVELLAADARRRGPDEARPAALQAGLSPLDGAAAALESRSLLPLLFETTVWAARSGLSYRPRRDQWTLAQNVVPAP